MTIRRSSTVGLFAEECARRGYPVTWLSYQSMKADIAGRPALFQWTRCPLNDTAAANIASNKNLAAKILTEHGVSVPEGEFFTRAQRAKALVYGASIFPCVVKPVRSHGHGRGCTVGVTTKSGLRAAWDHAASCDRRGVLVQREFTGDEARFMLVDGRVVSVLQKIPGRNGYVGGRETGITYRQIMDVVHPSYITTLEQVASAFPGLGVCGPDVKARDFTKPAKPGNHLVIEVNTAMGILGHHTPDHGAPVNVAGEIISALERRR